MKTNRIKIVYSEPDDYFPREVREKYRLGEFAMTPMEEKTRAVMIGHAVGDALGVPVEFCDREELIANPVTDMQGFGTYPYPAGCWSDDTSMSLATLDSISSGNVDLDDIMQNFGKWYYKDAYTPTGEMFDVGNTCSFAIENYVVGQKSVLECGLTEERANGNGSLMRIHPICLYLYCKKVPTDEAIDIIHKVSALTHAHQKSQMACGIYAYLLWELLENPSKSSVVKGLNKARRKYGCDGEFDHFNEKLMKRIGRIYRLWEDPDDYVPLTDDDIASSGYVVHTLEAAVWCLMNTHSYRDCVLKAVNLGGDTDTIAAVAGGLAGALYGYDSIPETWRETLAKRDYIEDMCKNACERWAAK